MNKHQLLEEFIQTWPIERLRLMTLEEYTNLNRQDSFCYWLEQRTNDLGGITGGSAFKFGIFKRTNYSNESATANTLSDGEYAWHEKYGTDRDAAFKTIREIIVSIATYSLEKKYNEIESIDFGSATKWKIAFLYSDYDLVNTFKKASIFSILDHLGAEYTVNDTRYELSQKILSFKKPEQDYFEFNGQFWQQILISQDLKKLLQKLRERVIPYFRILDSIVTQFQLEPDSEKYYFNYNTNELIFTIGQRYVWNVSKNSYKYISLENRSENVDVFESSKNVPEAFLNHIKEISATDEIFNSMKNAIDLELKSTVKSSFRKNNKLDFQELVFNRDYRERVFNSLNISGNTIVNDTKIEMNQLPSIPLNQILYGPPGTGKTYNTINKAIAIANPDFDLNQDRSLVKAEYQRLVDTGQIVFTTFHQSMTYEDFIEGIKPEIEENEDGAKSVVYEVKDGVFKGIVELAKKNKIVTNESNELYSFDDAWNQLIENVRQEVYDAMNDFNLDILTANKSLKVVEITDKGNLRIKPESLESLIYTVSYTRTKKLHEAFPDLSVVKNIDKEFRSVIGGSNSTAYWAVLNYINNTINSETKLSSQSLVLPPKPYVLIIDEINRGNLSQIFGELITLIEEDKRLGNDEALEVTLPYSKEKFGVPSNLYIIGTMNTADRSVEALDTALRRRFVFEEMPPKYDLDGLQKELFGFKAAEILKTINQRIEKLLDRDHQIGHAYFINKNETTIIDSFYKNMIPLLQEYFFGDYGKIGLVLGGGFIRKIEQHSVFANFEHLDFSQFEEKETYEIINHKNDSIGFSNALQLLMNR